MKITAAYLSVRHQQGNHNKPCAHDFEHLINTPTKQNSGNEFYWQHQAHLQNSNLKFEKEEPSPSKNNDHMTEKQQAVWEILTTVESTHHSMIPVPFNSPQIQNGSTQTNPMLFKNTKGPIQQSLYSLLITEAINHSCSPTLSTSTANKINDKQYMLNQTPLKKHHIFIEDDEVEISINSESTNPKEHFQLMQLLKSNLKDIGLSLKKIIINGVHYDG